MTFIAYDAYGELASTGLQEHMPHGLMHAFKPERCSLLTYIAYDAYGELACTGLQEDMPHALMHASKLERCWRLHVPSAWNPQIPNKR